MTKLLTIEDVAGRLCISKTTAWRLINRGDFPASMRVGWSRRWAESVVEDWLRARCPELEAGARA